ncbi:Dipeptidyl aminopeptidase BIII [Thalassocella blandensis]|nr:Dipeptidyl aminopeptidase BIII [Thalassocella blandensis]
MKDTISQDNQRSTSAPSLQIRPYGSWSSSISADLVAGKTPRISEARIFDDRIFWLETRPDEKGRVAIMMHQNGRNQCILPLPLSAKSKAHEYGGGSYVIKDSMVYFVLADDQRIYAGDFSLDVFEPIALTPDDGRRYADLRIDTQRQQLIAICEEHGESVKNYLVSIPLVNPELQVTTLTSGHDFYSNPEISPDGKQLCWLTWDHPNMPWDNSELWLADLTDTNQTLTLQNIRKVAGNGNESLFQPQFSPEGDLVFVSDHDNWWNIYRIHQQALATQDTTAEQLTQLKGECATPQWTFAMSTYTFIDPQTILLTYTANGAWQLCTLHCDTRTITPFASECSTIESVHAQNGHAVYIGATPTQSANVYHIHEQHHRPLRESQSLVDPKEFSIPQNLEFPTSHKQTAYVLFYPPHNQHFQSMNELPPLIVLSHGGPTGASESDLNYKIQFWTNRGFAVADVNYRGSTGFGRKYRRSLYPNWGEFDVDDVCNVVDFLSQQKLIDAKRCVIKGGSAGGYTTLAALAFRDTFAAGVSLYGIGDLEMLATDTHKFEARYLDQLVGPYPDQKAVYLERSPIYKVDQINCPLLVFQGLQDKVVPPNQAQRMVDAAREKGLPVAYVTYADEAHGFRDAASIEHMLDSELQFYAHIFDFPQPEAVIEKLNISNFPQPK